MMTTIHTKEQLKLALSSSEKHARAWPIKGNNFVSLLAEQVSLTQEFIETIVIPRVIVVKDKASWAFFGKLPQFTWMGYSFEHLKDTPHGEVCKITGFTSKKDRINKQIEHTSLEGTRVLFLDPKEEGNNVTPQFLESLL